MMRAKTDWSHISTGRVPTLQLETLSSNARPTKKKKRKKTGISLCFAQVVLELSILLP
jgi:hypothetical protein